MPTTTIHERPPSMQCELARALKAERKKEQRAEAPGERQRRRAAQAAARVPRLGNSMSTSTPTCFSKPSRLCQRSMGKKGSEGALQTAGPARSLTSSDVGCYP
jgi:hypothetical protein